MNILDSSCIKSRGAARFRGFLLNSTECGSILVGPVEAEVSIRESSLCGITWNSNYAIVLKLCALPNLNVSSLYSGSRCIQDYFCWICCNALLIRGALWFICGIRGRCCLPLRNSASELGRWNELGVFNELGFWNEYRWNLKIWYFLGVDLWIECLLVELGRV